jgi:hypothetical protein
MRQLHMRNLQLDPLSAEHGIILAPVELEGLAGTESQGNKGPATGGLLFTLTVDPPFPGECSNAVVRSVKPSAVRSECICFSVRRCLRGFAVSDFSHAASLPAKGSSLLGRSEMANFGSTLSAFRCFSTHSGLDAEGCRDPGTKPAEAERQATGLIRQPFYPEFRRARYLIGERTIMGNVLAGIRRCTYQRKYCTVSGTEPMSRFSEYWSRLK